MAVPIAYLTERQGADWKSVRVNIGLNDVDADGRAMLWWRPEWGGAVDYAGSGTFVRR